MNERSLIQFSLGIDVRSPPCCMWPSAEAGFGALRGSFGVVSASVDAGMSNAAPLPPSQHADPSAAQLAVRHAAVSSTAVAPPCVQGAPQGALEHDVLQKEPGLRRCQVPLCTAQPLSARTYTGRCRLCVTHMRADVVELGGQRLRFCQKRVDAHAARRHGQAR